MDAFVGDDEGCFVVVDHQACLCQVVSEVVPSLQGSLSKMLGIGVAAVKSNVIDPAIQVKIWVGLLKGVQDGLEVCFGQKWRLWASSCDSCGDMEPGADFTFSQNGLVSCIDLHGELQREWGVLEVLRCLLKPLQV